MTATVSLTICQYCEHANRADAKFCSGCGAPLHLIPCPTCGAVNQKTSKSCYQCHGRLHESSEILLAHEPAAAAGAAEAVGSMGAAPGMEPVVAPYPYVQVQARQRPSIAVVAIILAAFVAAAYFAYQQRSVIGIGSNSVKATEPSPANQSAGAINKASPALPSTKIAEPIAAAPETAGKIGTAEHNATAVPPQPVKPDEAVAVRPQPEGVRTTASRRRTPAVEPPVAPEAAAPAGTGRGRANAGIEMQPAKLGPCTEAVAALGLCTPEPTKGKE